MKNLLFQFLITISGNMFFCSLPVSACNEDINVEGRHKLMTQSKNDILFFHFICEYFFFLFITSYQQIKSATCWKQKPISCNNQFFKFIIVAQIHACIHTSYIRYNPLLFNPLSPHWLLYISCGNDNENLFDNQECLKLVIISIILVNFIFDLRVIRYREIRSQSCLGTKGLTTTYNDHNLYLLKTIKIIGNDFVFCDQLVLP